MKRPTGTRLTPQVLRKRYTVFEIDSIIDTTDPLSYRQTITACPDQDDGCMFEDEAKEWLLAHGQPGRTYTILSIYEVIPQ